MGRSVLHADGIMLPALHGNTEADMPAGKIRTQGSVTKVRVSEIRGMSTDVPEGTFRWSGQVHIGIHCSSVCRDALSGSGLKSVPGGMERTGKKSAATRSCVLIQFGAVR
jgi:hypothetical protein